MQKKIRNASIIALAVGLLAVPLVRYLMRRMNAVNEGDENNDHPTKRLFGAYLGRHKSHRHKAIAGNGKPL